MGDGNENGRPASVLTSDQREFLRMSEEERKDENDGYSRQLRSYYWNQIVARARQAFYDFELLYESIGRDERHQIFDPPESEVWELNQAVSETLAFLYHSLEGDADAPLSFVGDRSFITPFENVLEAGVQQGELNRHHDDFSAIVTVEFEVEVTPTVPEEVDWVGLIEALAEGETHRLDEETLRKAITQATNPTDRLRELADLVEEARDGDRYSPDRAEMTPTSHSDDEVADAARTVSELIEEMADDRDADQLDTDDVDTEGEE